MEIGTRIGTVRVRSAERDTPALRLAVSARLGGADLRPPGLPPAAILLVRSLAGRLSLRRGSPHSDPSWEQALREQLADLARRATRPDREWIAPGAEAILFTDEAEMLACLALDIARGKHLRRWWWRTILRTFTLPDLAHVLIEHARAAPAAFACLARWDEAVHVVRALAISDVTKVLEAVVRVHDLSPDLLLSEAVHPSPARGRGAGGEGSPGAASAADASPETAPPLSPSPPPWLRWLPVSQAAVLSREQERLLGIGLAVHLAPARARSRRFALEVRRWWRGSEPGAAPLAVGRSEEPPVEPPPTPSPPEPLGADFTAKRYTAPPTVETPRGASPSPEVPAAPRGFLERIGAAAGDAPRGVSTVEGEISSGPISVTHPPEAPLERFPLSQESVGTGESQSPEVSLPDDGFPTRLGGVLYLINLIEHCEDQKDDKGSRDEETSSSLTWPSLLSLMSFDFVPGPWGLLEIVARALLGALADEHEHDPLWPALAELDGRAPADRLDPALFPGLMSLLPAIRRRLEDALGVEPGEIAGTLLLCPGRIYVTSSHVDLVADLDRISLPVRRAGLDRDPGWVPRFGRVVLFHFE